MNLDAWAVLGLVAQMAFTGRFLVQWIASERSGRSVIPVSFWYMSLFGSAGLLLYAIARADPVFILGQSFGSIVYVRNLALIRRETRLGSPVSVDIRRTTARGTSSKIDESRRADPPSHRQGPPRDLSEGRIDVENFHIGASNPG